MIFINSRKYLCLAWLFCFLPLISLHAQVDISNPSQKESPAISPAKVLLDKVTGLRNEGKLDSALLCAAKAEILARETDDIQRQAVAILSQGVTKQYQGDEFEAVEFYQRARPLFVALKDTHYLALIASNTGNCLKNSGKYQESLEQSYEALRLLEASRDTFGLVHAHNSAGYIYIQMENFEKGIFHSKQALKFARATKDSTQIIRAFTGLGVAYSSASDFATGLKYHLRVLAMCNIPAFRPYALGNVGKSYIELGDYKKAYPYIMEARAIDSLNGKTGKLSLHDHNLGEWYARQGKVAPALKYYQKAIDSSLKYGINGVAVESYLSIYEMMEKRGDYKTALAYYIRFAEYRDSSSSLAAKATAMELEVRYKNERQKNVILKQDAEIAVLNQTNELQKANAARNRSLFAAAFFAIVLVIISLAILSRKRKRIMQVALQLKEKELRRSMEVILTKTQLLQQLEEQLGNMASSADAAYVDLATVIRNNVENEDDWQAFHQHFDQIHPQFLARLKKNYPILTQNDLRLVSLLRINIHTKEIAQILGISADSVKKAKIRLAKKLELGSQAEMIQLVMNFKAVV